MGVDVLVYVPKNKNLYHRDLGFLLELHHTRWYRLPEPLTDLGKIDYPTCIEALLSFLLELKDCAGSNDCEDSPSDHLPDILRTAEICDILRFTNAILLRDTSDFEPEGYILVTDLITLNK